MGNSGASVAHSMQHRRNFLQITAVGGLTANMAWYAVCLPTMGTFIIAVVSALFRAAFFNSEHER